MKRVILTICLLAVSAIVFGQHSGNLPNFSHNPLFHNPAYAGNIGTLDASISHYRENSALNTGNYKSLSILSINTPIKGTNWSLGSNIIRDEYYVSFATSFDGIVAYHLNFENDSKISFGALAGFNRNRVDYSNFRIEPMIVSDTTYVPEMGLGVLYQHRLGYFSVSMPDMLGLAWTEEDTNGFSYENKTPRMIYISGGLNIGLLKNKIVLQPSFMYSHRSFLAYSLKRNKLELGGSINLFDKVWLGSHYHLNLGDTNPLLNRINTSLGITLNAGFRISGQMSWEAGSGFGKDLNGGLMIGYRIPKSSTVQILGNRNFF